MEIPRCRNISDLLPKGHFRGHLSPANLLATAVGTWLYLAPMGSRYEPARIFWRVMDAGNVDPWPDSDHAGGQQRESVIPVRPTPRRQAQSASACNHSILQGSASRGTCTGQFWLPKCKKRPKKLRSPAEIKPKKAKKLPSSSPAEIIRVTKRNRDYGIM